MNIVTGTHRSGTSLVARLLFRAGADFGDQGGFYPADRWNPDGYFEQREILLLNRQLLQGPWGKFANLCPPSTARVRQRGQRLAGALRAAAERFRSCTVKDPRFNYTGPAWEEHGANIGKIVVCLREPMDVALSLRRRNRLPVVLGLHVWYDCIQRLFNNYSDRQMWFVSYARLTAHDTCIEEAAGLIRSLGLNYQEGPDSLWIRASVRTADKTACDFSYPAKVNSLWLHCLELSAKQREQTPAGDGSLSVH